LYGCPFAGMIIIPSLMLPLVFLHLQLVGLEL
jgi:hypothetical protein